MTDERMRQLRALVEAATPGPWMPAVWIETDGYEWRATGPGHEEHSHEHGSEPGCPDEQAAQHDAAFIAESRTAVVELLDEVDTLRAALSAMTKARDEACHYAEKYAGFTQAVSRVPAVDEPIKNRIAELRKVGQ